MTLDTEIEFVDSFDRVALEAYEIAKRNGFWEGDQDSDSQKIELIYSELAEITEARRKGNPPDDKIPEFSSIEIEAADVLIRLMDWCYKRGYRLSEATIAKIKYNSTRPYKNGGKGV